jgi:hypothetical protein
VRIFASLTNADGAHKCAANNPHHWFLEIHRSPLTALKAASALLYAPNHLP